MAQAVELDPAQRRFVQSVRRATLATIRPDGTPRLVPVCFVLATRDPDGPERLYSPLDEKPKATSDPRRLARVGDIVARPSVELLIDRWSEDWTELAWLRLDAEATLLEPGDGPEHAWAVSALREKHLQYRTHDLEARPMIRLRVTTVAHWGAVG